MPKKFESCVKKVKKKSPNVNPYAVCRVSTKFFGSTRHKKKK
jgi:hypothetical protein